MSIKDQSKLLSSFLVFYFFVCQETSWHLYLRRQMQQAFSTSPASAFPAEMERAVYHPHTHSVTVRHMTVRELSSAA